MEICGHRLPDRLVELIEEGRWKPTEALMALLPATEQADYEPQFYLPEEIERETAWFLEVEGRFKAMKAGERREALLAGWLGSHEQGVTPGKIDSSHVVLIGDARMDSPIALYYHRSRNDPAVIYSMASGTWIEIAPHFSFFAEALGF